MMSAETWNDLYPVGTRVDVIDGAVVTQTITEGPAVLRPSGLVTVPVQTTSEHRLRDGGRCICDVLVSLCRPVDPPRTRETKAK